MQTPTDIVMELHCCSAAEAYELTSLALNQQVESLYSSLSTSAGSIDLTRQEHQALKQKLRQLLESRSSTLRNAL